MTEPGSRGVALAEVLAVVDRLWPVGDAEDWDAVGLVVGDPESRVSRILLAVDPVRATVAEAIGSGADLLLCHHPLLLRGVKSVAQDRYKGALVTALIRGGCALITAHTNADAPTDGVSDLLARRLGVQDAVPLRAVASGDPGSGIGRVGTLAEPVRLAEFADRVAGALARTAGGVRVAGDPDLDVRRVALCAGAGDGFLADPAVASADVYVTADLRHHPASEAREQAALRGGTPALVDVSHWASEALWLDVAADALRRELPGVTVEVSRARTDPWDFVVGSGSVDDATHPTHSEEDR